MRVRCVIFFCIVGQVFANFRESGAPDDISKYQQKLSPYELAMVSDLLIQISMYRCPAVSRPAMKSLKRFVFTTFSKATEVGVSHPLFYSNYRTLVECLNYIDVHFPKKSLASLNQEKGLDYVEKRRKRETTNSNSEEANALYPGEDFKKAFKVKKPFELLFNDLYGIVKNSCPSELAPNPDFVARSMTEIVEWTATHSMTLQAQDKYFDRLGILKQIHKCLNLVSSITTQLPTATS